MRYQCETCGCEVWDKEIHLKWHKALAALAEHVMTGKTVSYIKLGEL